MNKLAWPMCGALVVSLAACGGKSDGGASSSAKGSNVASNTSSPTSNTPTTQTPSSSAGPANLMKLVGSNGSMKWSGGMLVAATNDAVSGWVPGMGEAANCPIKLAQGDETLESSQPGVAATKSDDPKVVVSYVAKKPASGLNPEETHDYVQTLDLKDCSLGQRVDLMGKAVPTDVGAGPVTPIATKGDVLVYQTLGQSAKGSDGMLVGFDAKKGQVAWALHDSSSSVNVDTDTTSDTLNTYLLLHEENDAFNTKDNLINAADGKVLADDVNFHNPSGNLDDDHVLYSNDSTLPAPQFILSGGKSTPVKGGIFSGDQATFMDDGSGHRVMVGFYFPSGHVEDKALGYVGVDGTIKQILPADKVSALSLQLLGGSNGRLYVKTTSQNLVVGLEGKQIGQPYDSQDYPYSPVGEERLQGALYTLWGDNDSGSIVTKDAKEAPPTS